MFFTGLLVNQRWRELLSPFLNALCWLHRKAWKTEFNEKVTKIRFSPKKWPTFESGEIFEIKDRHFDGVVELNAVVRSDFKFDTRISRICTFCRIIETKVRILICKFGIVAETYASRFVKSVLLRRFNFWHIFRDYGSSKFQNLKFG